MKTMSCKQLGGACNKKFKAESFEEMALQSQQHATDMVQEKDIPHLEAMAKMQKLMKSPIAMQEWMDKKRKEFEALPDLRE